MDEPPLARTEQQTDNPTDDQSALRTSALFLLAAVSVLIIGSARPFVAIVLPVGVPSESSQLALLRLQYELFGAMIFCAYAVLYWWFERGESPLRRFAKALARAPSLRGRAGVRAAIDHRYACPGIVSAGCK